MTAKKRTARRGRPPADPNRWPAVFIAALKRVGNVAWACRATGVGQAAAYLKRQRDPDFAEQWRNAIEEAAGRLMAEATRRAREGVNKPVIHQGKMVFYWVDADGNPTTPKAKGAKKVPLTVKEYSDPLLMFLLKGLMPDTFRERHELSGSVGGSGPTVVNVREVIVRTREEAAHILAGESQPKPLLPMGGVIDGGDEEAG